MFHQRVTTADPIDVGALYERYGPMVLRRCRALLRDEEMARDAMHDVFVNVLRRSGELNSRAPSSLLYRIATNVSLNKIRGAKHWDGDDALLANIAHAEDLESQAKARSVLRNLLGPLPKDTGAMAVMHLHDGFTLEEVATEFGLSVSGIRKRLRGLRTRLDSMEDAA